MKHRRMIWKGTAVLTCLMMTLSLAGCGKQKEEEPEEVAITEYTEDEFDAAVENGEYAEEFEEEEPSDEGGNSPIEEVKAEDCIVRFLEPKIKEGQEFSIVAAMENHSKEVTYMVAVEPVYVNGYNCSLSAAEELKPGESKKTEILLNQEVLGQLEKGGCGEVRTLDLYTRVFDAENYLSEPVYNECITLHPYEDDYYPVYERGVLDTDTIFMDTEEVQVVLTEAAIVEPAEDSAEVFTEGYSWKLFLKNKTGSSILYSLEDVTLNGISVDPCWSMAVKGEGCSYAEVFWPKELLDENKITEVEEVIFSLVLYDEENSDSDWRVCENITYQP